MLLTGRKWAGLRAGVLALAAMFTLPDAALAQDTLKGVTVTVVKATKTCFAATAEVFGVMLPMEEVSVTPPREGLRISQVLVDPGATVTVGPGADPPHPAGGRGDHTRCPGRRHRQQCQRHGRHLGLRTGRSAVPHHRARRVRNGRRRAGQGHAGARHRPGRDHPRGRRAVRARPRPQRLVDDRPDHPGRPGPHPDHHAAAAAAGQRLRPGHHQDRRKLQRCGSADRHPLWQRRRGDPGRAAAAGRDQAGRGRPDVRQARSRSRRD